MGLSKPESLRIVAEIWRPQKLRDDSSCIELRDLNHKTLEKLDEYDLLNEANTSSYNHITHYWIFPLYDLNMHSIPVKESKLREIQERWYPEY